MRVELKTEEDFDGVMYTRGSFYKQSEPCFVKPKRAGKTLEMKFNLDQCQTSTTVRFTQTSWSFSTIRIWSRLETLPSPWNVTSGSHVALPLMLRFKLGTGNVLLDCGRFGFFFGCFNFTFIFANDTNSHSRTWEQHQHQQQPRHTNITNHTDESRSVNTHARSR